MASECRYGFSAAASALTAALEWLHGGCSQLCDAQECTNAGHNHSLSAEKTEWCFTE